MNTSKRPSKGVIIFEANQIESLFNSLYYGTEEFTLLNRTTILKRLQTIRDEARKIGNDSETST
jgi:hypothetical protein